MQTVYAITQHIITGKPYEKKPFQPIKINSQIATTYQLLTNATHSELVEKVRSFVSGKLSLESIEINQDNAYQYLAAAKVVDLDTDPSEMIKSTYKIRKRALLSSQAEKNGRQEIKMLNAFSMPPYKNDLDILLVNELDRHHPIVKKAAFGEERNRYLKRIYAYSQKEAVLMPEIIPLIEKIVKDRFQTLMKIAALLPDQTTVIYKGCSGAGKTFALKKFTEQYIKGIDSRKFVQSTDNIKNDLRQQTQNSFSDEQVDLLGMAVSKMFSEVMKEYYPKLATIQEGWFNSTFTIESLFKDLKSAELKLNMHDFDGDYEAICLRILARSNDKDNPTVPFNQIERSFQTSRESRQLLLKLLRETDSYQFYFVHADGIVNENIDPKSVLSDPESVNLEIEATKMTLITKRHVHLFGDHLHSFIGMTIEEAFEKIQVV